MKRLLRKTLNRIVRSTLQGLRIPELLGDLEDTNRQATCQAATLATGVHFNTGATVSNLQGQPERIQVGRDSVICGELLIFAHGGSIEIGEWCFIGAHSRVWSAAQIKIGNHVLLSHNVNIHDTNSHALAAESRRKEIHAIFTGSHLADPNLPIRSAPVTIEDDAWVGFNASILKGVTVGRGAIIAAGTLVTEDVSPWTVVGGTPMRTLYKIPEAERVRDMT